MIIWFYCQIPRVYVHIYIYIYIWADSENESGGPKNPARLRAGDFLVIGHPKLTFGVPNLAHSSFRGVQSLDLGCPTLKNGLKSDFYKSLVSSH